MAVHPVPGHVETDTAHGTMLTRTAAALYVRSFPPFYSDEPPEREGDDRGPAPLEYVLAALCA